MKLILWACRVSDLNIQRSCVHAGFFRKGLKNLLFFFKENLHFILTTCKWRKKKPLEPGWTEAHLSHHERYVVRGHDLGVSCQHGSGSDPLLSPRGGGGEFSQQTAGGSRSVCVCVCAACCPEGGRDGDVRAPPLHPSWFIHSDKCSDCK